MKRRSFLKKITGLFAALPFVGCAKIEQDVPTIPESESVPESVLDSIREDVEYVFRVPKEQYDKIFVRGYGEKSVDVYDFGWLSYIKEQFNLPDSFVFRNNSGNRWCNVQSWRYSEPVETDKEGKRVYVITIYGSVDNPRVLADIENDIRSAEDHLNCYTRKSALGDSEYYLEMAFTKDLADSSRLWTSEMHRNNMYHSSPNTNPAIDLIDVTFV